MKEKIKKAGAKIERIAVMVLLSLCAVFFCGLAYYCARYTWQDSTGIPFEIQDNGLINFLVLLGFTVVFFVLYRIYCNKRLMKVREFFRARLPYVVGVVSVYLFLISIWWVSYSHVEPSGDGMSLCNVANRMLAGNYVDMMEKGYMYIFPHQFGLLSVIHSIFTWFGVMNYKVFQYINAACIPLLFYSGYRMIRLIYDRVGAVIAYILCFVTCMPLFFYIPYVYGEVISITFTMVFMWQVIRFRKTGKKSSFLWGTIAIVIACFVRNNSFIVLIAAGIVLCIHDLKEVKLKGLVWLLMVALLISGSQQLVRTYYENVSGLEVADGVPYISWVRMGLQDSWAGPGWFDNSSIEVFKENGYDAKQTVLEEKERLNEMLEDMWEDKAVSIDFFRRKILSQWNAPGYRYVYETRNFDCEYAELSDVSRNIYYHDEMKVQNFMNHYQFLVYFFTALQTIFLLLDKKKKYCLEEYLLYVALIGGVLFTAIWESGSRYILPYLVYMLPLAAIGLCRLMKKMELFLKVRLFKVGHP